jgi:HEAT repeat protein
MRWDGLAVPALSAALKDPVADVRAEAVVAIAEIGTNPTDNVPLVARMLNDPAAEVRYAAVFALGTYGPKAKVVAPLLLSKMATSRDTFERTVAAWAAVRVAPSRKTNKAALPLMVAALQLPNPEGRVEAAHTLGLIGAGSKAAISALKIATKDEDAAVRKAAAAVLKKIDK